MIKLKCWLPRKISLFIIVQTKVMCQKRKRKRIIACSRKKLNWFNVTIYDTGIAEKSQKCSIYNLSVKSINDLQMREHTINHEKDTLYTTKVSPLIKALTGIILVKLLYL